MSLEYFPTQDAAETALALVGGAGAVAYRLDGSWELRTTDHWIPPAELVISMLQFKLQLDVAGKLDLAETAVAGYARKKRLQWQYLTTVTRVSPLSNSLKTSLGYTNGQWTNLFKAASLLLTDD